MTTESTASLAGPVAPTPDARLTVRPLAIGAARIRSGLWAERQRVNRDIAIPEGEKQLRQSGTLDNLRAAAGDAPGPYRGPIFTDSDVYKWLEAVAWEQSRESSEELTRLQRQLTAIVEKAQADDGYLNSYVQVVAGDGKRFADLAFGHELYCAGHLIQAAVAQKRATGDERLLEVASRFADYLGAIFGPGKRQGVGGHPEIETALVELYRLTGRTDYLQLATYFIDARGYGLLGSPSRDLSYFQDRVPIRGATSVEGHAVRALYLAAGASDVAAETGDEELTTALADQWHDMVGTKAYLTGGVGSRWDGEAFGPAYELPPDRAYCETCAAIASIHWSWRMLLATGEAPFADLIERTLFNAFLPGLSLEGDRFFYVNPLHVRSDMDTTHRRSPAHGRQPWYTTACCPPNIMRLLSSLDHYLATVDDSGVQVHQYAGCAIRTHLGREAVGVDVATEYPWDGRVDAHVRATPDRPWTLSLRIPGWCREVAAAVNDEDVSPDELAPLGGYLRLHRRWRPGDRVTLHLSMPARLTVADARIDAVRGCAAIERGPLVYCLEQVDQESGVSVDDIQLATDGLAVRHDDKLLGGVTVVKARGEVRRTPNPATSPYHDIAEDAESRSTSVQLTAVPYYAWANRELGPMRVWVPLTDSTTSGQLR